MNHLINSLKVNMQCLEEGMAFNVRHHFAQNMQSEMIEIIEEICTRYSAEVEWLRIDKLEIDVGNFDTTVFDKNFKTIFAKKFEKILLDKINNISLAEKKHTQLKSLAEAVRCFLLNGILPWWVDRNNFDVNDAVLNFLLKQTDEAKLFFIQQQNNQLVWERVTLQLNNAAKEAIIQYFGALQSAQKMLADVLQSIFKTVDRNNTVDIVAKQEDVNNLILKSAPVFLREQLNEALVTKILKDGIKEIVLKSAVIFNEIIFELNKKVGFKDNGDDSLNKKEIILKNDALELILSKENNNKNEIEKYLVPQAGIVLLSPFYKPFFTNLKLLEAGKWVSKEAQIKAVHLLYFISTGLLEAPEYNVTLEKVLCGLPMAFPVPLKMDLSQAEIGECESLIKSAIEHWDALKSTSVQGLRQMFLQREGILKPKENGWLLQVERKTLDVLLEKIPWGFTTIFLPWVNKLINVEW